MVPPQSPCLNYDIQLFGACGTFLNYSANAGCATETINAGNLATGSYRIVVLGVGGAFSGTSTYSLTVATGAGCGVDPGEPNETQATAAPITAFTPLTRYICPSTDVDWYAFTLASAQQVTVTVLPPQSPCLDYDVQLYSGAGTFLTFSANGGCYAETLSAGTLAAGTYGIVVLGYQGASSASVPYTILLATTAGSCASETGEPNNACAQATAITLPSTLVRFICPTNDDDWYQFSLASAATVNIRMYPPQNPCLDYDLVVESACGTTVSSSTNSNCLLETLALPLSAGTYRIRILGFNGAFSVISPYTLSVY
jgi:hypothetical protein